MRRALVAALVAGLVAAQPAAAAEQQAYATGLTYATPAVVAGKGDTLRFNNLDPAAQHDLDSDQPGLFDSPLVGMGGSAVVAGVEKLEPGTYAFHCSLHSWMKGALTVSASGGGGPSPGPSPSPGPGGGGSSGNPVDLLPKADAKPLSSSDWPFYGKDLANSRNGGPSGPSWNEVGRMGPVWSFHSADGDFTGTPVVSRGVLVAGSFGGTVVGIDASTGKVLWQRDLFPGGLDSAKQLNGTPALYRGVAYVPVAEANRPRVVALDLKTGALKWDAVLDTQKNADVFGSPVVSKGVVYVGTSAEYGELNDPEVNVRGSVVALDAKSGHERWKTYVVPAGHDGGSVWSTPAIDVKRRLLYVGTGNAYHAPAADTTDAVLALSTRTGAIRAKLQGTAGDVWNATGNVADGPDHDFGASPNLIEGPSGQKLVGIGSKAGIYWALARRSLKPAWSTMTGPTVTPVGGIVGSTAYDGKRVYGPITPGGEVWALGRDGSRAWVSADGGPAHFAPVSAGNGLVWSADMSGQMTARDAKTGVVAGQLPLGGPAWGGVAIAGGYVFGMTGSQRSDGWIVAYRVRD